MRRETGFSDGPEHPKGPLDEPRATASGNDQVNGGGGADTLSDLAGGGTLEDGIGNDSLLTT
jgi:hypothetical protein